MSLFFPHERYKSILQVSPQKLYQSGVRGVILDIDNTLTTHDNPKPADGVLNWLCEAREAGLILVVLSNNSAERVEPFAKMLGLEFEADGKKPLPFGYRRAVRHMGVSVKTTASIGDQIFTDVLGARLCGVKSIFVDPIEPEKTAFFKLKRALEIPVLNAFERRRAKNER